MKHLITTLMALGAFLHLNAQIMPNASGASYDVTPLGFNTSASEFAPVLVQTGLAFCKAKEFDVWASPKDVGNSVDCYHSVMKNNEYGIDVTPQKLWGAFDCKEAKGAFAFSPDGLQAYFTRQKAAKKDQPLTWGIYVAGWEGGHWDSPVRFDHNMPGYDVAHPTLSADGRTLYFASDMRGGYGGMDIYVCHKIGNGWSRPANLGPNVNSIYNEIYPSVHRDGTVYFSSNGHDGVGGYDLFATQSYDGLEWAVPVNLGEPLNSRFDDFGITVGGDKTFGYLSSNRKGVETDADLYYFKEREVFAEQFPSFKPVPVAPQQVQEEAKPEYRGNTAKVQTGYDGAEEQTYERTDWEISGDTPETFRAQAVAGGANTTEVAANSPIVKGDLLNEYVGMDKFRFDRGAFRITESVASELDKLSKYMRIHDDLVIEIGSHTDTRAEDNVNLNLSIHRAHAARSYLLSKGIAPHRVVARGYGESEPLNRCVNGINCPDVYHMQNDRIEVKLLGGVIDDSAVRYVANKRNAKDVFGVEKYKMDETGEYYQLHIGPFAELDHRTYSECKKLKKSIHVDQQPKGETLIVGPYLTASDAVRALQFLNTQGIQKVRINGLHVKDEMHKNKFEATPVAAKLPKVKVEDKASTPKKAANDEVSGNYQVFVGPFRHVDSDTYARLKNMGTEINLRMTNVGMMVVLGPFNSRYKAETIRQTAEQQVGKKVRSDVFLITGEKIKGRKKRRLFQRLFGK